MQQGIQAVLDVSLVMNNKELIKKYFTTTIFQSFGKNTLLHTSKNKKVMTVIKIKETT